MHRIILLLTATSLIWAEGGASDNGSSSSSSSGGEAVAPKGDNTMMLVIMAVFAFLIFSMFSAGRKQKKQEAERRAAVSRVKIGDTIMTFAGITGTVERLGETTIDVRTGGKDGSVVTFVKDAIKNVVDPNAPAIAATGAKP